MRAIRQRELGAGDRADAEGLRCVRELERPVQAVVVGESESFVPELRRLDGSSSGSDAPSRNEYDE